MQIARILSKGNILQYGRNLSLYFLASLIPMVLNLLTYPLIAMNMSPKDYAIVGYFGSFGTLTSPLMGFSLAQYYVRNYYVVDEEGRKKLKAVVFKMLLSFSFIVAFICYLAISAYIHFFNFNLDFPVFPYLLLSIIGTPIGGIYTLQVADYKMQKNAKSFFRVTVLNGVSLTALNLLLVAVLKSGAFGKLLSPVIVGLLFFVWVLSKNKGCLQIKTSWKDFISMLTFCWPLALGAMLGYFTNGYDKTYLESLKDTTTYGYYVVGANIAAYLTVFASAISVTFQPDVYESIIKNQRSRLIKTYAVQTGLISFITIVFIILCPYVISILTAGRYVDSTPYARIIALSTIASTIYYNINGFTIGKGFPRLYLYTTALGSVCIVLAMKYFVSAFAYDGAAIMNSVSFLIFSVINIVFLWIALRLKNVKEIE